MSPASDGPDPGPAAPFDSAPLTIAAVAAATGVSEHTLRAWERRYGIPQPERSACRYRLYERRDLDLIRMMRDLVLHGVRPSVAAIRAREELERCETGDCGDLRGELLSALLDEDETAANSAISAAAESVDPGRLVSDLIGPVLYGVGFSWLRGGQGCERWAASVMREHLETVAAQIEPADGRRAVLAVVPGERSEVPLLCLRLSLAHRGWRSTLLTGLSSVDGIVDAALQSEPELAVFPVTCPCRRPAAFGAAEGIRSRLPACRTVVVGDSGPAAERPAGVGDESDLWAVMGAAAS